MSKLNVGLFLRCALALTSLTIGPACSPERNIARDYCQTYEECSPAEFDRLYDSLGECTAVTKRWNKAYYFEAKKTISVECAKADRAFSRCAEDRRTCDSFSDDRYINEDWWDYVYVACAAEVAEYQVHCTADDDYYY